MPWMIAEWELSKKTVQREITCASVNFVLFGVYEEWSTRSDEQCLKLFHQENRDDHEGIVSGTWGIWL